ncbi:hypothetical protein [Bdellovibrio bacteriovorus]|uniref:hypothetical protein n=1 Tax=Bdellovibrio bacteriovorus TaxID=959 RepID=UPI0035A5E121
MRKQVQHWNYVQEILTDLKIQPHEYFSKRKSFCKYFQKECTSKSYVEKLLKIVKLWGEFYSEQARTYFKRLPNPKGIALEAIVEASAADSEEATPFIQQLLMKMPGQMLLGQWEYMRATLWLGLRPSDLDLIIEDSSKHKSVQGEVTIFSVYQPKLTSVPKEKGWKHMPLFHAEMMAALNDLESGNLVKPLVKTIRSAASKVEGLGLYSGRKRFTDLMPGLGQSLENIFMWLGHSSIERTGKHHKDKHLVKFNPMLQKQR